MSRKNPTKQLRDLRNANSQTAQLLINFAMENDQPRWSKGHESFPGMTEALFEDAEDEWLTVVGEWALFHRIPAHPRSRELPSPHTFAARLLEERGGDLPEDVVQFIETARREPFRIWQILDVDPGRSLDLSDLLTDREVTVYDETASESLPRWAIICAHVVGWDGVHLMASIAPRALPPMAAHDIKRSLERVRVDTPRKLISTQDRVLREFMRAVEDLILRSPLATSNTEGHAFVFARSTYAFSETDRDEIIAALSAVDDLEPVDGQSADDSEPSRGGKPAQVSGVRGWGSVPLELVWLAPPQGRFGAQTTLGRLVIGEGRITTECNSVERDAGLRAKLDAALGSRISLERSEQEPLDYETALRRREGGHAPPDTVEASPEIFAVLDDMLLSWLDEEVPALGGMTPRDAVKTDEGRRRVEALIRDFERSPVQGVPGYHFDHDKLRRELGIL